MLVCDAAHTEMDALFFQNVPEFLQMLQEKYGMQAVDAFLNGRSTRMTVSVTYYPDVNEFRGRVTPQIVITHYR